jgi:hypothetical protein
MLNGAKLAIDGGNVRYIDQKVDEFCGTCMKGQEVACLRKEDCQKEDEN